MAAFGIALVLMGVIFILIARWIRKFAESTKDEWKTAAARILFYNTEDYSSRDVPVVEFTDDDGNRTTASASPVPSKNRPEPGTEVTVEYRKNFFENRKPTYQVVIAGGNGKGEKTVPVIFLTLGIVMTAAGAAVFTAAFL